LPCNSLTGIVNIAKKITLYKIDFQFRFIFITIIQNKDTYSRILDFMSHCILFHFMYLRNILYFYGFYECDCRLSFTSTSEPSILFWRRSSTSKILIGICRISIRHRESAISWFFFVFPNADRWSNGCPRKNGHISIL
jgi:hypothetical protein